MSSTNQRVIPGDVVGTTDTLEPGEGTFVNKNVIYSAIDGTKREITATDGKKSICVDPIKSQIIPEVGDVVLARVISVTLRMAYLRILCVNNKVVSDTFRGTIKKEHVRAFEVDKVVMYKSFRIGDIVRARVLSRGDRRSYYLSTDRNDLGVVLATSSTGTVMIPVSWEMMQDPETKAVEYRKVAKLLSDEEVRELKNKQELDALVN
ncbi:exosome complex component CSL4 [Blastocystis sp. ATCC 50177/Nand II]|uniref:Exosome complex component CSL4 n=1 Tax=Blastocystis sp. subtype 1 (strain ATCC 50177 / NandII) TaxID=478820 RepID=A0A196S9H4_BLAHN|nr:exosome complex component CSL4 [Blastocystis sp. ATCC 50177/Nand II]